MGLFSFIRRGLAMQPLEPEPEPEFTVPDLTPEVVTAILADSGFPVADDGADSQGAVTAGPPGLVAVYWRDEDAPHETAERWLAGMAPVLEYAGYRTRMISGWVSPSSLLVWTEGGY